LGKRRRGSSITTTEGKITAFYIRGKERRKKEKPISTEGRRGGETLS